MALKISIGGTTYPYNPGSLRITEQIGQRATADFAIHQLKSTMTHFQRGQPVIIYDDEEQETVDLSTVFDPYGAPGVLWNYGHDGIVSYSLIDAVDDAEHGTFELLVAIQTGVEDMLAVTDGRLNFFRLNSADSAGDYSSTLQELYFKTSNGKLVLHLDSSTWYGSGLSNDIEIITDPDDQEFIEGQVYRISVTWAHDAGTPGTTTFRLYVDGVQRGSDSGTGWLTHDAYSYWVVHLFPVFSVAVDYGETYCADFRLYSSEQSETTIDTNKFDRLVGTETDLICYWMMDEGTGTTVEDSTANGYDGSLSIDYGAALPEWGVAIQDWTGTYDGTGTHDDDLVDYRWFTGRIENVKEVKVSPDQYESRIQCTDLSARLDERTMNANINGMLAGDVIKAYIPRYFGADLIGVRTVSDGVTVSNLRLQFDKARKVMDDLKQYSDYIWYVDAYKELRFHAASSVAAPFDIDNSDIDHDYYPIGGIKHEGLNSNYANRIIARAQFENGYAAFIAQDDTEIAARIAIEGGTGIYERYVDLATVRSQAHGEMLTKGLLSDAIDVGVNISYVTRYPRGLRVGMSQHIKHTEFNIDDDFIITGLTYELAGGIDPQYAVKLSSCRAYQDFGNQLQEMVESKSNFRPSGMAQIYPVTYP